MSESPSGPATRIVTGADLRAALEAAAIAVDRHAAAINALNVFPVPDGDTGTNMALTLRSATEAARGAPESGVGDVAAAAARGALMGARGNSGVILAQMFRGIAGAIAGRADMDAATLAGALQAGSDAAYTAVTKPVEGTILTVARAAATEAEIAARDGAGAADVLARAHAAARAAVARTPEQLPVLKQAGVVDSGGEGYRVLLEALAASFRGEPLGAEATPVDVRSDLSALHDENDTYGYCTEVLFQGEAIDLPAVRGRLMELGTSVLVVGDPRLARLHVHTTHPGRALEIALDQGEIVNVKVDNIGLQRQELAAAPPSSEPVDSQIREEGTALVAVAAGAGFREIFASLGATVVAGADAMNASVEQILDAISRTPRADVIVLPNDPNTLLASETAARMAVGRAVQVLPTRTMPQGIAAALALNPELPLDANLRPLADAAGRCQTIALARAVREATVDDVAVARGQVLAVMDGRAVGAAATTHEVLRAALDALPAGAYEIATVYVGAEGSERTAESLAATLTDRLSVPAEIVSGGQPSYDYIISVE